MMQVAEASRTNSVFLGFFCFFFYKPRVKWPKARAVREVGLTSSCFGAVKVLHIVEVLEYFPTGIVHGQSEQVEEYQSERNAIKTPSEM